MLNKAKLLLKGSTKKDIREQGSGIFREFLERVDWKNYVDEFNKTIKERLPEIKDEIAIPCVKVMFPNKSFFESLDTLEMVSICYNIFYLTKRGDNNLYYVSMQLAFLRLVHELCKFISELSVKDRLCEGDKILESFVDKKNDNSANNLEYFIESLVNFDRRHEYFAEDVFNKIIEGTKPYQSTSDLINSVVCFADWLSYNINNGH